ncbi:LysM peptidoglycan-binding domain-containing protein [Neisseriaceae bacterium B1]
MKSIKSIALAISSLFILPSLAHGKTIQPTQTGLAMMRLQASAFSVPNDTILGGSIWSRLRGDFRMGEVNSNLVRNHEYKFAANSAYFNRTINRSTPFMYHITQEVQKRGMPAEIALLPFIESAYVTKARSHVGASGLWQFMPATGRHYGLEQTPLYDGRHDIYAATDAALNYLEYLHGLFGDWSLALAAYNWGEGNVSRAIRRAQEQGLPPTYENLKMPAETRNYVPKLLAVRNLVNNPQAFGLRLPEIANSPYFKEVEVKDPMDIMAAAFLANIPEDEFLTLNPAFKTPVFIPKGKKRRMLLPIAAAKTFESNYKEADTKTLLSWDVFTPTSSIDLNTLASQTGSSVGELKRLNGLRGNSVAAGRTILLNKNTAATLNQPFSGSLKDFAKLDFDPVPDTFVEQAPVLSKQEANLAIAQAAAPQASSPIQGIDHSAPVPKVDFAQAPPTKMNATPTAIAQTKAIAEKAAQVAEKQEKITPVITPSKQDVVTEIAAPIKEATPFIVIADKSSTDVEKNVATAVNESAQVENSISNTIEVVKSDDKPKDALMSLVQATQERKEAAAQAVRDSLAKSNAAEAKALAAFQAKEAVEAKRKAQQEAADAAKAKALVANKAKAEKNDKTATKKAAKSVTYEVNSGDTLYSIAKRYNTDVADLVAANGIKSNSIKPGQVLKVSGKGKTADKDKTAKADIKNTKAKTAKSDSKDTKAKSKAKTVPASYKVRKGDTLESIANRYDLKVSDLKRLNKGSSALKTGQMLKLD